MKKRFPGFMPPPFRRLITAAGLFLALSLPAGTREIASPVLTVTVDTTFPRLIKYRWNATGAALDATATALDTVKINGTNYHPKVVASPAGKAAMNYILTVVEMNAIIDLRISVSNNVVDYAVTAIHETGANFVRTLAIPDLSFITVSSLNAGAVTASRVPAADVSFKVAETKTNDKPQGFTHVVANTDKLAASLWNNVLLDTDRIWVLTRAENGQKETHVSCPAWTWREIPTETVALPEAKIVITSDANGDGVVDWQDGAMAYRDSAVEPKPFGAEYTRNRVQSQIAMNFASEAQHPFLRVLDEVKKMYLFTDGLGQEIQFKGYQSEGHDSSHPDYGGNVGTRQGGRDELNFVMQRMKDFNARAGIHINATEYYPEAKHYSADLVNTNKPGWAWLDQSYYTDKRYDITSGKLYQRLEEMRADLPYLDWVYVDVYFGTGWEAEKLAHKMNSLGLPIYTEFEGYMERFATWEHRPQDWTQRVWGDGRKSHLARFIQNQEKDVWTHDPLLRGSQNDGYLGWHSQRDLHVVIRSTFVVNLPSKYLQYFPVMRWTEKRVNFGGGVSSTDDGGVMKIQRDSRLINRCRYSGTNLPPADCASFIPWDPIKETKIYYWNDQSGTTTWDLPASWQKVTEARLYELTGLGRVFIRTVPISNGKLTLDEKAKTPYVLYKETPPALPEIVWGEGSLVKDPGFNSHGFNWWTPSSTDGQVSIVNDSHAQTHLRIQGNGGAAADVSQTLYLAGGKTYAASVWVELKGKRTASLTIRPVKTGAAAFAPLDRTGWKIIHADSEEKGRAKEGPAALLLDGDKSTIWHTQYTGAQPGFPHEVVMDLDGNVTAAGFYYTPRANRGPGTIEHFELYLSQDGNNWGEPVAAGAFSEMESVDDSFQVHFDQPVTAHFLKFVALSEMFNDEGGKFASGAEIGLLNPAPIEEAQATFKPVTDRVEKSNVKNFNDNADKYLTHYQRVKVLFDLPAGVNRAEIVLHADAGEATSAATFDDVRVVEAKRSERHGHDYFEDFENVDEGWGPFVYGYKGSTRTHLSEAHPPFTDDVIEGKYSLKTFDEDSGLNFRTTPALLKFQPNTKYRLAFDYKTRNNGQYQVVIRTDDGGAAAEKLSMSLAGENLDTKHFTAEFTTDNFGDYYIGFVKNGGGDWLGPKPGADKVKKDTRAILVIDNLAVDQAK